MKTMLISTTISVFVLGTAFAHEVAAIRVALPYGTVTKVDRRVSQIYSGGVPCTVTYITTKRADGITKTRKSADCEE